MPRAIWGFQEGGPFSGDGRGVIAGVLDTSFQQVYGDGDRLLGPSEDYYTHESDGPPPPHFGANFIGCRHFLS